MKYLMSAFLFSFLFATCLNTTKEDSNGLTAPPTQLPGSEGITSTVTVVDTLTGRPMLAEKPVNALSSAIGESPKRIIDQLMPKMTPPNPQTEQEKRVIRVLTQDLWAVWSLIRINDKPATRANQGTWFNFHEDGTYEYGFWDEPISGGTWHFDGKKAFLNLDSKLKGDDRQWKVQMGNGEQVMVWTGTERYTTTDISLKLEKFVNVPKTRAELGVRE